jgi:hypothetical protein
MPDTITLTTRALISVPVDRVAEPESVVEQSIIVRDFCLMHFADEPTKAFSSYSVPTEHHAFVIVPDVNVTAT